MASKELIGNFHSLTGTTINERRRNLYRFLIKLKPNGDEINFEAIKPRTHLEELFKIETLIFFKKTNQLMPVLRCEDLILIKKVLNNDWFVREAFGNLSGDELVSEILPKISYMAKIELLGKLALYLPARKCEEFFESIHDAYGSSLARKLLPSCSGAFILRHMEGHKINFSSSQLLRVLKRNPELVEIVLEKIHKQKEKVAIGQKYGHVFRFLLQFHSGLFLKLYDKYTPEMRLGARATKKFLTEQTHYVVDNSKKFGKILRKEEIPKTLGEKFAQFYCNLLPKSLNDFETYLDHYLDFLKYVPSSKKLEILTDSFRTVYGYEMWTRPFLIKEDLVAMMSVEEREIFMQNHSKPTMLSEEVWISFMGVEKSIPLLKEKILLTSNKTQRVKLVCALIKTCKINKDHEALLDVCDYILKRHRNEEFEIRLEITVCLIDSFDWRKLSDRHWERIRELVRLIEVEAKYRPYHVSELYKYDVYRRCEKNLDVEDLIKEGIKMGGQSFLNVCLSNNQKYEKVYLSAFPKVVASVFTKENDLIYAYVDYLSKVQDYNYNQRRKINKISYFLHEEPVRYFKMDLERDSPNYSTYGVLVEMITNEYDRAFEWGLVTLFLEKVSIFNPSLTIKLLLNKNPLLLLDALAPLIKPSYRIDGLLQLYKFYEHANLPQNISSKCLDLVRQKSEKYVDREEIERAVLVLSHTMRSEEFINFVKTFCQKKSKPISTKEERDVFKIQKCLLDKLKVTKLHLEALECVLTYQQGEFKEIVTNTSVAIAKQINEDALFDFLQRSSPNKQSILLAQLFFTKRAFKDSLIALTGENDPSLRKYTYRAALKYFAKNPGEFAWSLLKSLLETLKEEDVEIYSIFAKFKEIPSEYFVQYVTLTWNALESSANLNEGAHGGKSNFLEAIGAKNIALLPKSFCFDIVKGHFLKFGESEDQEKFRKNINAFVCNYLIHHSPEDVVEERVRPIVSMVKKYVSATWYDSKTVSNGHKVVFAFVKAFCCNYLDKEHVNDQVLDSFMRVWLENFAPREAIDEFLYIRLTSIYLRCLTNRESMKELGQNLGKLCIELDEGGLANIRIFCRSLERFKQRFVSLDEDGDVDENYLKVVEGILSCGSSQFLLKVALFMLPDGVTMAPKVKEGIEGIVDKILLSKDPLIQIHVNHYLVQDKSDMYWCY